MPRLLICMQIIYLQTKLAIYHNNLFYSASIDKWQKSGKNVRDQIFVCCHSLVLVWMYGRWYQWNCWNNIWSSFLIIIFFPVITRDVMSVGITQSLSSIWPDSELIKDLRKTASSAPPSGWLWPRSVICVLKEDLVEGLSSGEWGGACDNHDDGEALPVILCDTCGNLCADCDRFLHLQSKTSCKTSWSWLVLIHANLYIFSRNSDLTSVRP